MVNNYLAALVAVGLLAACDRTEGPPTYTGVVELEETVLGFELGGRLDGREVERGDAVVAGQVLARLDDELEMVAREAKADEMEGARSQVDVLRAGAKTAELLAMAAELQAAATRLRELERDLEREKKLFGHGATARAVVDDLAAKVDEAKWQRAAIEQRLVSAKQGARIEEIAVAAAHADALAAGVALSDLRLDRHALLAPTAGVVLDLHAEPGEILAAGVPVVTVGDPAHPFVEVFVPQADLAGIAPGTKARVTTDASPDGLPARVEHVYDRLEFTPRFLFSDQERPNLVLRVRVRVDDERRTLHPGTPAFVRFQP